MEKKAATEVAQTCAEPEDVVESEIRACAVERPKPDDVERLRAILKRDPSAWQGVGDLMSQARGAMIESAELGNMKTPVAESMTEGIRRVRRDLGFKEATTLERLLIEQILTAWVRLALLEAAHATNFGSIDRAGQVHWDRVLTAAQGRFLRSVECLARVRRLLRPKVAQVNIATNGGQQVNAISDF